VRRLPAILTLLCCCQWLAGCAAEPVAPVLAMTHADYGRVFDAALEAARAEGMQPVVVDRELGVIETLPRTAGSLVEPWRTDNAGLDDMVAHTINFERRRARFEFVPDSFAMEPPPMGTRSDGPPVAGSDRAQARFDLLHHDGSIEMRAWVYVDRGFVANRRIGHWTLGESTVATDPTKAQAKDDDSTRIPTDWTPIGRDVPYEQRLMGRIRSLLANPGEAPATAPQPLPAPAAEPATAGVPVADAVR
jgi:hypothetical protein